MQRVSRSRFLRGITAHKNRQLQNVEGQLHGGSQKLRCQTTPQQRGHSVHGTAIYSVHRQQIQPVASMYITQDCYIIHR